jgi:ferrous iron transport protein B
MDAMIALAGNPNAGKTTLFNNLTGSRQHVGNYPGVTVEKKEGFYRYNGHRFNIVDLPGTYSLTAYSLEEVVARDFLIHEKPGVVVNIVDASNLERNLYLTLQFMELGMPVCIALNMMDMADHRGITIDHEKLSQLLGVPVVPTIARSGKGKEELTRSVVDILENTALKSEKRVSYGADIDSALDEMSTVIEGAQFLTETYPARWIALKYMENDEQILGLGHKTNARISKQLEAVVERVSTHIRQTLNSYPEAVIADQRYGYIKSILKQDVITYGGDRNRLFISDKIDKVVVNRFAGPLIMLAVLFGLYHFTFTYSEVPVAWMEGMFGWLGSVVEDHMPEGLLKSLITSGIIDGVGGVLGFVPLIMFMFFGIAILEDSGYLARVAFMLDRVFRVFGLHGSSVMAFIVSGGIAGGCAVPGVMATRTLKSRKERIATLLTVPFMNCGAKLPVFALLVAAFSARRRH